MKRAIAILIGCLPILCGCSALDSWYDDLAGNPLSLSESGSSGILRFSEPTYTLTLGESANVADWVRLVGIGTRQSNLQWFINNDAIVTIAEDGTLTPQTPGTTTLKATWGTLSDTTTITVLAAANRFENVTAAKTYGLITTSQSEQLLFNLEEDGSTYANLNITDLQEHLDCGLFFSSSDTTILNVDQTGTITPISNGNATITLSCDDNTLPIEFVVDCFTTTSETTSTTVADNTREILMSVSVSLDSEYEAGDTKLLKANLNFNTGTVKNVSRSFVTPLGQTGSVAWSSPNAKITIANSVATFVSYGAGEIQLDVLDKNFATPVNIKMKREAPETDSDQFLGYDDFPGYEDWEDDTCPTIEFGENGGFASYLCPEILMNQPYGPLHVVSFGSGGEITIELNGYYPVDGPGPDFIIFSNPLVSGDDGSLFAERAKVAVSKNGSSYTAFDCDPFDPEKIYAGCAGVGVVDTTALYDETFDPEKVGGDSFDLADLGVSFIRFLKITDLKTCVEGDDTYEESYGVPLCQASGKEGFDLDAIMILNGQRE